MPTSEHAAVAVVTDTRLADHRPADGSPHPERPERLAAVLEAVAASAVMRLPVPPPADDATLLLVHDAAHLARVADLSRAGGRYDADTYISVVGDVTARRAVACCVSAADAVLDGRCRRAFAAVRPPGHHALPDRAMGFCTYANAALAVRHMQRRRGVQRVAVVDIDVHHGNGTQDVFKRDPTVLVCSLHEDPHTLWPGTGHAHETGEADGAGFTLNVPLPARTGDDAYLDALSRVVLPRVVDFKPDVIVVAAGFDAHARDPLAHLQLSSDVFGEIARMIASVADACCEGRIVATLEGGYDADALREGVAAFLDGLA